MRLRRYLQAAAVSLFGIALALSLVEMLARVTCAPSAPVRERPSTEASSDLPRLKTIMQLAQPNTRGVFKGAVHRTNSAGFRGREYAADKPADVFRVLIGGDSVTMGSGVEEEQTYPALLEAALNREAGPRRYEVLNLGLAGLNIRQVVQRIEGIGLRFDPDLIVYGFTVNDIEGPAYQRASGKALARRYAATARFRNARLHLLRCLWPRWQSLRDVVAPQETSYHHVLKQNYFHNPPAWAEFTTALDRLATLGIAHDACVVVLLHTRLDYLNFLHPYHPIYERVAYAVQDRGMTPIPTFDFFRGRRTENLWVGPIDAHPNATGHEILARALLKGLRQLPKQCFHRRREGDARSLPSRRVTKDRQVK